MIGNTEAIIQWLFKQTKDKLFEIKEHKDKRTLTQNSYYWALVNEIANKMRLSKDELHFKLLKDYSQLAEVTIRADINIKGYIKYYEEVRQAKINNVDFKIYKVYKGSSEMNKEEFNILLDGAIQEAQQLNIPTMTKKEIEKLRYIENET